MPAEVSVELPRTTEAPFLARCALAEIDGEVDPAILTDVQLLVSELVTNSVKYGDGPVRLRVTASAERVRAEVVDQGSGFDPRVGGADPGEIGGWGLSLVEQLTTEWGTHEGSTHVWFEIDARDPARSAQT